MNAKSVCVGTIRIAALCATALFAGGVTFGTSVSASAAPAHAVSFDDDGDLFLIAGSGDQRFSCHRKSHDLQVNKRKIRILGAPVACAQIKGLYVETTTWDPKSTIDLRPMKALDTPALEFTNLHGNPRNVFGTSRHDIVMYSVADDQPLVGPRVTLKLFKGDDYVDSMAFDAVVRTGSGDDHVAFEERFVRVTKSDSFVDVRTGRGNDIVIVNAHGTYRTGKGDDVVNGVGPGKVLGGPGDDIALALPEHFNGGPGSDSVQDTFANNLLIESPRPRRFVATVSIGTSGTRRMTIDNTESFSGVFYGPDLEVTMSPRTRIEMSILNDPNNPEITLTVHVPGGGWTEGDHTITAPGLQSVSWTGEPTLIVDAAP